MTRFLPYIRTLFLTTGTVMAFAPSAYAVVAKPGLHTVAQPDGTTISIRLEGDHFRHRAYSSDGYLLTTDAEGFYVFAETGDDGLPKPSQLKALDPSDRSPELSDALSKLNQSEITDAFNRLDNSNVRTRANTHQKGPGLFTTTFPSIGEQKSIVILVDFPNKEFSLDDPHDYFYRLLNEEGFSDEGGTGSARDFFVSNSSGKFTPDFDLYGPLTLAHPLSYYGQNDAWGNDRRPHEMVIEACQMLDEEVDFSQYDRNDDGFIDNVYVFYAGYGEADGGGAATVWPHSYNVTYATSEAYMFDGVQLDHYACSNELSHRDDKPDGIGTFTHEFSHVMGLPDLYATSYTSGAFTPGEWNILDQGSYNNNSRTPPNYSAFERYALDWMEPSVIDKEGDYTLEPIHISNMAYMMHTDAENEYFLIENRQQEGFDTYIPGHGMLVWHIDFDQKIWDENQVNNNYQHQYVDLIEADNKKTNATRAGDSFPGTYNVTSFTYETKPALLSWNKVSPGFDILDIAESDEGIISFTAVKTGWSGVTTVSGDSESGLIISGNTVRAAEGTADIYDLTGRKVASVGASPVTLSPGVYLSSSSKFIIK